MTINEMIEQGITFQGERVVTYWDGDPDGRDVVAYSGSDEWWGMASRSLMI